MVDIAIEVTDRKGRISQLAGTEGLTLMDALRSRGLPVAATCGGAKSCATCHVYIGKGSPPLDLPDEDEVDLLSESDHYREGVSPPTSPILPSPPPHPPPL